MPATGIGDGVDQSEALWLSPEKLWVAATRLMRSFGVGLGDAHHDPENRPVPLDLTRSCDISAFLQ